MVRGRGEAEAEPREGNWEELEFGRGLDNSFGGSTDKGATDEATILNLRMQLEEANNLLVEEREFSSRLFRDFQAALFERDQAKEQKNRSDEKLRTLEAKYGEEALMEKMREINGLRDQLEEALRQHEAVNYGAQVTSLEQHIDELQDSIGYQGQRIQQLEREKEEMEDWANSMEDWANSMEEQFRNQLLGAQRQFEGFLIGTCEEYERCLDEKHDEVDQLLTRLATLEGNGDRLDSAEEERGQWMATEAKLMQELADQRAKVKRVKRAILNYSLYTEEKEQLMKREIERLRQFDPDNMTLIIEIK